MKTKLLIITGIIFVLAASMASIYLAYNQEIKIATGMMQGDEKPEPLHNSRLKIEGSMADKICTITGGHCPSYYIGNIQEDGSVMVGITFSDTTKEKQFIFFIKNDTLSYEIKEN